MRTAIAYIAFIVVAFAKPAPEIVLKQIRILPAEKALIIPAKINQSEGPIEFLLVHSSGKVHESVFATDIPVLEIAAAFALLGHESDTTNLEHPPSLTTLENYPEIEISIQKQGGEAWIPVTQYFSLADSLENLEKHPWVYTGSYFHRNNFMASIEGNLAAIYSNGSAIINMEHPQRLNDNVWLAEHALPKDTPVHLKFVISSPKK